MSVQGECLAGCHPEMVAGGVSCESCVFAITQPAFINTLPMGNIIPTAPAETWLHLLLLSTCLPTSPWVQKGKVQHTPFLAKEMILGLFSYASCVGNAMSRSTRREIVLTQVFYSVFNSWGRISSSCPTCEAPAVSPSTEILQHSSCYDKDLMAILSPQSISDNSV